MGEKKGRSLASSPFLLSWGNVSFLLIGSWYWFEIVQQEFTGLWCFQKPRNSGHADKTPTFFLPCFLGQKNKGRCSIFWNTYVLDASLSFMMVLLSSVCAAFNSLPTHIFYRMDTRLWALWAVVEINNINDTMQLSEASRRWVRL